MPAAGSRRKGVWESEKKKEKGGEEGMQKKETETVLVSVHSSIDSSLLSLIFKNLQDFLNPLT